MNFMSILGVWADCHGRIVDRQAQVVHAILAGLDENSTLKRPSRSGEVKDFDFNPGYKVVDSSVTGNVRWRALEKVG
jgi:hypothetical protein